MKDTSDVFNAEASSVIDTFYMEAGVASFRIPSYQRQYSWDERNIRRLLEDIVDGTLALGKLKDNISFLGTILLVDDNKEKEITFNGRSLSIVDG